MDASMAVGFLQLQHTKKQHDHDKTGDAEMKQTHNGLLESVRVVVHLYQITQEIYRPLIDRQREVQTAKQTQTRRQANRNTQIKRVCPR